MMKKHWMLTLCLNWFLAFALGRGVLAQDDSKLPTPQMPLEQLLNSDGPLNLQTGFNDSLNSPGVTTASGSGQPALGQLDYFADTDGDGFIDRVTVVVNGIQVVHGQTGTTKLYSYSGVNFSLSTFVKDTDGVPGVEIIVIWAGAAPSNGIDVIHDRTGGTKTYRQDRQFSISEVSDTDGEAGDEIIVIWAGAVPNNGIQVIRDRTGTTSGSRYQQNRQFSISKVIDTDGEPGNEIIVIWVREFPVNGIDVIHDRTQTTNPYPQNTTFTINDARDYDGVSGAEICISWFSGSTLYAVIVDRTRKTIRTSGCDFNQAARSFRTHQSGDWGEISTWEEYTPNIGWTYPASQIPNIGHGAISIRPGHAVAIRSLDVNAKQLTVDGTLQVADTLLVSETLNLNGTLINNGTARIYGTVQVNQGGAASGNDFIYMGSSSRLVLQNGTHSVDNGTAFWPSTISPGNVTVQNGASVVLNTARTVTGSLVVFGALQIAGTLQVAGTLEVSGALTNNGATQVSGTVQVDEGGAAGGNGFVYTGPNSRLVLNGMHSIDNGTAFWPGANSPANVTVQNNASVMLNTARTVNGSLEVFGTLQVADLLTTSGSTQIVGTFQINQGGAVSGNSFVYTNASSALVLNGTCSIDRGNVFWPSPGGPANVTVRYPVSVTLNVARTVSGSLEVDGTLQVADSLTTNGTTAVGGTLIVNGALTNYGAMENYGACQISGTLTNNGTTTSHGTYQVAGTLLNNGTQNLNMCQVSGTLTNHGETHINFSFQLDQGGAVTGNKFVYEDFAKLVFNHASGSYSVKSDDIIWPGVSGPWGVAVQGPGGITMNVARTVQQFETAAAVTNADSLKISGTVAISSGGVFDVSPTYEGEISLVYNGPGVHNVGVEWTRGTVVGPGVPMNVTIHDSAIVNMPNSPRTCLGDIYISGTLVLSPTPGADLSVGGNWQNDYYQPGMLVPNSRAVIFNGTAEQSIRGVTTFDALTVINPAGIAVPGYDDSETQQIDSVTVRQALTFTAGNIRLGRVWRSFLILSGSVNGASTTRHVVTYGGPTRGENYKGRVVRSIAAGDNFQFPIGPTETSYNPLTIALDPADSTETFSVQVDSTVNPSSPADSLLVQRTWDIQEATPGDNHAALTFQWSGAEEGTKFTRNASSTYLYDGDYVEVVQNGVASGTDPYIVSTTGGFPCTEFGSLPSSASSQYVIGRSGGLTAVEESKNGIPTSFMLGQNYPNPFNPSTTIRYALPTAGFVMLTVYNLIGAEIETLVNEKQPAGDYTVRWNPLGVPSGVYFYRLQVGEASSGSTPRFVATRKLILLQ